jgi:hypothetical protein
LDSAIHLRELESLWNKGLTTKYEAGVELVNFQRCTEATEEIKRILQFQLIRYDLERYREAGPLAYLEANLSNFQADEDMKLALDLRGKELAELEKKSFMLRDREIRDAGFGSRKPKKPTSPRGRRGTDYPYM